MTNTLTNQIKALKKTLKRNVNNKGIDSILNRFELRKTENKDTKIGMILNAYAAFNNEKRNLMKSYINTVNLMKPVGRLQECIGLT